jgi:hypothetical protein
MRDASGIEQVASAIHDLSSDLFVNLCSEIEETRNRVSEVASAVSALILPAYISAISLGIIAYQLAVR